MIQYPEGLPLPLREGYGFDPVSPMVSTPLVTEGKSGAAPIRMYRPELLSPGCSVRQKRNCLKAGLSMF